MKKLVWMVVVVLTFCAHAAAGKTIRWGASPSADVVAYRLYFQLAPDPVTKASTYVDVGNVTMIDTAATLPALDGTYNIGVTAIDDAGNESASMSTKNDVVIDTVLPDPPGPIFVEN